MSEALSSARTGYNKGERMWIEAKECCFERYQLYRLFKAEWDGHNFLTISNNKYKIEDIDYVWSKETICEV